MSGERVSPVYLVSAFVLPLALPALCIAWQPNVAAAVKWMAFWAVGVRLGLAGLRQVVNPTFTAGILGVHDPAALPLVREVGMANLSFAALALVSMAVSGWRLAAILAGGVYFGLAALGHLGHKAASRTETVALVSDVLVFAALATVLVLAAK